MTFVWQVNSCRVAQERVIWQNSYRYADLAQLVEQLSCKQQVMGSSPIVGSGAPRFSLNLGVLFVVALFAIADVGCTMGSDVQLM